MGSWFLIPRCIIANAYINMHNSYAVPPSTKAPLIPEANHWKKIETIVRADLIGAHKLHFFSIFSSISLGDNPSAPPINDQHGLINISLWLSTGTVVLNHIILRLTCWWWPPNHLFLTLNYDHFLNYLLVSVLSLLVFCKVTFMWRRNATSIQAGSEWLY